MNNRPFVTAILLASGEGRRFLKKTPKQFHLLSGKKIYLYPLEVFCSCSFIDSIIITASPLYKDIVQKETSGFHKPIKIIEGGATRQLSCYKALEACPKEATHVIIHDGVRPFLTETILKENIQLATLYGACDTAVPSYDTIVHTTNFKTLHEIPPRSQYWRGQTPQSFSYSLIKKAHEQALKSHIDDATDDCQLVLRLSHPVYLAKGSDENIKITTEQDLLLAEQILRLSTCQTVASQSLSLERKIFAVTGASGGLGQAITNALKKEKAHVLEISRSSRYCADLTSVEQTKKIFNEIYETFGEIHGLINAAGLLIKKPLSELSDLLLLEMIHTNFTATALSCKYCRIQKEGHIINLSSSSYTRGREDYMVYSAMKAAVVNFTQGLSQEKKDLHIHALIPSRTNTEMRRKNFPADAPELLLEPEEVADKLIELLKNKGMTGMVVEITKN